MIYYTVQSLVGSAKGQENLEEPKMVSVHAVLYMYSIYVNNNHFLFTVHGEDTIHYMIVDTLDWDKFGFHNIIWYIIGETMSLQPKVTFFYPVNRHTLSVVCE